MDHGLLDAFVALAEERHYRRAADRVFVTQPALSRRIQRLEAEVGTALVERGRGGVSLTAAGAVFLDGARRVLDEAQRAALAARRAARGETGRLVVGFVDPAMYGVLPDVLRAYQVERPDVDLVLREVPSHLQAEALRQGAIDVAFSGIRPDGMRSETVASDAVVLAVAADHRLASATAVPLGELAGEPFVFPSRSAEPGVFDRLLGLCERAGFAPRIAHQAERMSSILGLVAGGLGVAFAPESVSRGLGSREVSFVPLADPVSAVALRLVWNPDRVAPPLGRFIEIALEATASGPG